MKTISLKTHWVATDGWRGYEEPINAVCGANDTGTWSDSPCPSDIRAEELSRAKKLLRQNKIAYKQTWCRSSNAFCGYCYVCVAPEDKERAKEILQPLYSETRLLYIC